MIPSLMSNGDKKNFFRVINGVFTILFMFWNKRFLLWSMILVEIMFSVPNIPLTLKATNLCAAKQDSNDF